MTFSNLRPTSQKRRWKLVEAWVNEHVPGVKAMTTGFESIDIVLDYVDKGGGHC